MALEKVSANKVYNGVLTKYRFKVRLLSSICSVWHADPVVISERCVGRIDGPVQPLHPRQRIFDAQGPSFDLSGWSYLHRRHRVRHIVPTQPLTRLATNPSPVLKKAVSSAQLQKRASPFSSQTPHPVVRASKVKTKTGTSGQALASTSTPPIRSMRHTTTCLRMSRRSCRKSLPQTS